MKRDMDLCRAILQSMEQCDRGFHAPVPKIGGQDDRRVAYHMELLADAGLVEVYRPPGSDLLAALKSHSRLTWKGHEFLDAARPDDRWERAKKLAKEAGSVTFDMLKETLVKLATEALSRAMGNA